MEYYQRELYYEIEFYEFIQYEFDRQWHQLKTYANEKGIKIIGDIPIYVAYDSADVWAHPELFQIDDTGKLKAVAGCPPDGFSLTGQMWGNPLYRWDYHRETGYDWWIRRIEKCIQLYDVIRIDHFRGFDQYFSIPEGAKDATGGHWENGPGIDLFNTIRSRLGEIQIIAEDLGYITDSVRQLVRDTGFPNMKVLEFAFDSRDSSGPAEYLPYNYDKNCVVYTGTHDNETLLGWLNKILPEEVEMIRKYIGKDVRKKEDLVYEMIRMAQSSNANFCIIPIQDYLCLGNESRINTPSTLGENWKWRVAKEQLSDELAEKIKEYTVLYGRA
jgi:4-alpha-glucanotransferase